MSTDEVTDEGSGNRSGVMVDASKRSIAMLLIATTVIVAIATSLVLATDIILILFLAVLFGIFLYRTSQLVTQYVSIPDSWSLVAVTTLCLLLLGVSVLVFGAQIQTQISKAGEHMDEGVAKLRELADEYPALNSAFKSTPLLKNFAADKADRTQSTNKNNPPDDEEKGNFSRNKTTEDDESGENTNKDNSSGENTSENANSQQSKSRSSSMSSSAVSSVKSATQRAVTVIGSFFSTTFGLVVNSLLIFFVGLYLATDPAMYRDGCVRLMPPKKRERTREILDEMGDQMWKWLLGRFGSMLVTGIGASVILWILGVPMAVSLGIATGLLTFIPNIGAAIAFILAFLVALSQGVSVALWLIPAYMVLQLLESYLVTPLIQQQQVSIPPALLISFQAIAGVLFGFLGAAIASPLLVALKVGVQEAYIKDVLGDES